jgi:hypothetical protein
MRFALGAAIVDVIVDIDDFQLPLIEFLPGIDVNHPLAHRDSLEEFISTAHLQRALTDHQSRG